MLSGLDKSGSHHWANTTRIADYVDVARLDCFRKEELRVPVSLVLSVKTTATFVELASHFFHYGVFYAIFGLRPDFI